MSNKSSDAKAGVVKNATISPSGQTALPWAERELISSEEKFKAKLKEKGFNDLYQWKKGENRLIFSTKEPRKITTKFGEKVVMEVKDQTGKTWDVMVSAESRLYRDILTNLIQGNNYMVIVRTGDKEHNNIRYEIIEASKI